MIEFDAFVILVKLFDWRNETWISLGRFCGKNFPPAVTASGDNMKILFRSNGNHQGDGFRVRFKLIRSFTRYTLIELSFE